MKAMVLKSWGEELSLEEIPDPKSKYLLPSRPYK